MDQSRPGGPRNASQYTYAYIRGGRAKTDKSALRRVLYCIIYSVYAVGGGY